MSNLILSSAESNDSNDKWVRAQDINLSAIK